ncbi:gluconokinase [Peterkaempfera bronchialis]|uniref:Gluconokinase n=1 Tax=Peterkaempfera bronchialis TaxID=2126346 RepID=A0A345T1B7_9ACTN|nr:gluconokinase [Peterkaempfera bronchialis]AXI79772.1 gluconokinase [Peterkaempfera bronchialis]
MGVTGAGKTTVGRALAEALGADYADADAFHSAGNVAKMSAGKPLDDSDRQPWLRAVGDWLGTRGATGGVVSCSALKRSYRTILRERGPGVWFLHLAGPPDVAAARVGGREDHFMPVSLVTAQYAALEPLTADEPGLTVEFVRPPEQIVEQAQRALAEIQIHPPKEVV